MSPLDFARDPEPVEGQAVLGRRVDISKHPNQPVRRAALAQGHSTLGLERFGDLGDIGLCLPAAGHEQAKRVEWLPDMDWLGFAHLAGALCAALLPPPAKRDPVVEPWFSSLPVSHLASPSG